MPGGKEGKKMEKLRIAVLFGGCSTEYEISLQSAGAVLSAGVAAVLPQLPSSTAHSTAAPRRRLHLRFMGFSPY